MNNIQITYPTLDFDFNELTLLQPTIISGGTYLTKILHRNNPLYLQIPKCNTKQGIVKHNKKISCDILLNNLNEELIGWFENLDNRCKDIFVQKSLEWFSTPLEKDDVDNLFTPTLKLYRSGKYSMVKTNIKMNSSNEQPLIKIYDETQQSVPIESITSETNLIFILEIVGIKFTSRNFSLEVEIKQAMTVKEVEEDIPFKKCLIKPIETITFRSNIKPELYVDNTGTFEDALALTNHLSTPMSNKEVSTNSSLTINVEDINNENMNETNPISNDNNVENIHIESDLSFLQEDKKNHITENIKEQPLESEVITLTKPLYTDEIVPLDDVEEILAEEPTEMLELHKPEDIYYELYKTAKQKVKEALLEVKRIKQQYNIYTSDDETDDDDNDDGSVENTNYNFEEL
jgi:hypothetical protein